MTDYLMHIGTKYHSGRYPYGSGENPYQHDPGFYGQVKQLRKEGMTDAQIAKARGMTSTQLKAYMAIERNRIAAANQAEALKLKEKGYSNVAIGERMGVPESTVRNWLKESTRAKTDVLTKTADVLKSNIGPDRYLDIGLGVENQLGISKTKLDTAARMLEAEGYNIYKIKVNQVFGNGNKTEIMVLAPPEATFMDVVKNRERIKTVNGYSDDNMKSFMSFDKIQSVNSDRVQIRYGDKGGKDFDGVIELRRGVDDLSLGQAQYAQVRIGVDDTHYMKGMAIYRDDMPKGVDIIYNTNKPTGTDPGKVFKEMKDVSLDDPGIFGAVVRQQKYRDKDGKEHLSPINIVNEEGDWGKWSRTLASQVLSKQKPDLAKSLLKKAYDAKASEYDDISKLTNPAVKKALLEEFADGCDSAATHLKAAAMPRQASHVILPLTDIKPTEVYAPNYRDGERVALIRYPHGGKFEIPDLVVNNRRSKQAKESFPSAKDAIGIHPEVAERLSGADFDGDTVLVIPNNNGQILSSAPLKGLKDFDPKIAYPAYEGMTRMTKENRGIEMGKVTNLITDMTIRGATPSELARAVRHSMVVIDAEKHNLNYKQSYIDNGIAQLKERYQGSPTAGASTIISRASAEVHLPKRKEKLAVSKMTPEEKAAYARGEKIYEYTGETYVNKQGKTVYRTSKNTRMAEAKDAFELSSGTTIEKVYAIHANDLKALALKARAEARATPNATYSPSAKKVYADEVASLKSKLNTALQNKPKERQAQLVANILIDAKKASNPELFEDKADIKKLKAQALTEARIRTGASKSDVLIDITDKEWNAIQSGAVSHNTLTQILSNTDMDRVKELATPKQSSGRGLSTSQIARAKAMIASGRTQAEVADALGISTTTLNRALK